MAVIYSVIFWSFVAQVAEAIHFQPNPTLYPAPDEGQILMLMILQAKVSPTLNGQPVKADAGQQLLSSRTR